MLAAGVGCYLAGSTFSQVALARGATARAGFVWALSAIVFIAVELSATGDAVHRVAIAFLIATALNAALFIPLVMRREPAPAEAAVGAPRRRVGGRVAQPRARRGCAARRYGAVSGGRSVTGGRPAG